MIGKIVQQNMFGDETELKLNKSYRAIRHDVVRMKQLTNKEETHHPGHKIEQIEKILDGKNGLHIVEFFSGRGNLTGSYEKFGNVEQYDRKYKKSGDSYLLFHRMIAEKRVFDVIDIDPYGFPSRFFPDIYLLINEGVLFVTMPKPNVNILNGITELHLVSYFGEKNPSMGNILNRIALWGICHWRKVELLSAVDCKSVWRFAFSVKKVKATEYTGVKNR